MSKKVLKSKPVVWRAWQSIFLYYQSLLMDPVDKLDSAQIGLIMACRTMFGVGAGGGRGNRWSYTEKSNKVKVRCPTEWNLFDFGYGRMLRVIRNIQKFPFDYNDETIELVRDFILILDFEAQRLLCEGKFSEAERLRDWIREAHGLVIVCGSDKKAADFYKFAHEEEIKRQKEAGKALHDLRQRNKEAKEAEAKKAAEEAAAKKPAAKKGATKRQKKT